MRRNCLEYREEEFVGTLAPGRARAGLLYLSAAATLPVSVVEQVTRAVTAVTQEAKVKYGT